MLLTLVGEVAGDNVPEKKVLLADEVAVEGEADVDALDRVDSRPELVTVAERLSGVDVDADGKPKLDVGVATGVEAALVVELALVLALELGVELATKDPPLDEGRVMKLVVKPVLDDGKVVLDSVSGMETVEALELLLLLTASILLDDDDVDISVEVDAEMCGALELEGGLEVEGRLVVDPEIDPAAVLEALLIVLPDIDDLDVNVKAEVELRSMLELNNERKADIDVLTAVVLENELDTKDEVAFVLDIVADFVEGELLDRAEFTNGPDEVDAASVVFDAEVPIIVEDGEVNLVVLVMVVSLRRMTLVDSKDVVDKTRLVGEADVRFRLDDDMLIDEN